MRKSNGWHKTVTGYRVYSKVNHNCPRLNVLYNSLYTCTSCIMYIIYCTFRIIDRDGGRGRVVSFSRVHTAQHTPHSEKSKKGKPKAGADRKVCEVWTKKSKQKCDYSVCDENAKLWWRMRICDTVFHVQLLHTHSPPWSWSRPIYFNGFGEYMLIATPSLQSV